MTRGRAAAGALLGIGLTIAVVAIAVTHEAEPARCAEGMIAEGPRCCGEGQHLDGDRCAGKPTRCSRTMMVTADGCVAASGVVRIEAGTLHVGPGDWEAQGVVETYEAKLEAFALDATEVTEQRYETCVVAGSCALIPLRGEPGRALAGVTREEAARYCAWAGGSLPSGDELAFASAGAAGRRYPWGDTGAVCRRAAWGLADGPCGHGASGPELAGAHPDGASPAGVLDLAGNVAEWTRTPSGPSGHIEALAEVRGGSWTDTEAASLRSWHRREIPADTRAPDVGFRCAYPPDRANDAGALPRGSSN